MQDIGEAIEGFVFEDEKVNRQALREFSYIEKMKGSMSNLKPEQLKEFYHKLIDKHIFTTQVGYTFLYEIRSTLVEQYHIPDEQLDEIIIPKGEEVQVKQTNDSGLRDQIDKLKRTKKLMTYVIVTLIVVIIGFFVIIATNDNIGYINTESKIVNKYAKWQEELEERERILDEREASLGEDVNQESIDTTAE